MNRIHPYLFQGAGQANARIDGRGAGSHQLIFSPGIQRELCSAARDYFAGLFYGYKKRKAPRTRPVFPDAKATSNSSFGRSDTATSKNAPCGLDQIKLQFRESPASAVMQPPPRSFADELADWVQKASGDEQRAKAKQKIEKWIRRGDQDQELDLSGLKLTELPPFPRGVEYLIIHGNQLTSLDGLPDTLKELSAGGNQLQRLDRLPLSVQRVTLDDNKITDMRPDLLGELKMLRYLELARNRIVNVRQIESLNPSCQIYLEHNPLSDTMHARLQQLLQRSAHERPHVVYTSNQEPAPIQRPASSLLNEEFSLDLESDNDIESLSTAGDDIESLADERAFDSPQSRNRIDSLLSDWNDEA